MPKNKTNGRASSRRRSIRRSGNRPTMIQAAEMLFAGHSPNDELDLNKDMPNRINPAAQDLWWEVLKVHGDRINKEGGEQAGGPDYPGVSKFVLRAALALTIFARACREHGLDPFLTDAVTVSPTDTKKNTEPAQENDYEDDADEGEEDDYEDDADEGEEDDYEDDADEGEEDAGYSDLGEYEQMVVDWFNENPAPISLGKLVKALNADLDEEEAWTQKELLETVEGLDGFEVEYKKPRSASKIIPPDLDEEEEGVEDPSAVEPGDARWYEEDDYADFDLSEREIDDAHIQSDDYFGLDDEDLEKGTDPESLEDDKSRDKHWRTEDPGEDTEWFAPKGMEMPEDDEYDGESASATYAYLRWYVGGSDGVRKARQTVLTTVRKVLRKNTLQFVNSQGRLNRMDAPDIRQDRVRFIPGGYDPLAEGEMDPAYKIRFFQNLAPKAGSKAEVSLTEDQVRNLVQRLKGGGGGGQWRYPYVTERHQKRWDAIKFIPTDFEGNEHVKLDLFLQFFPQEDDRGEETGKFTVSIFYAFLIEEADAAALVGFTGKRFADGDNRPNQRVMMALSKYALRWSRQGYPPEMEDQSDLFRRRGPRAAKRGRRGPKRKRASVQKPIKKQRKFRPVR